MREFDKTKWQQEMLRDAKSLYMPEGLTSTIIEKVSEALDEWLSRSERSSEQITDFIVGELQKYHRDLAYVYQNRSKII